MIKVYQIMNKIKKTGSQVQKNKVDMHILLMINLFYKTLIKNYRRRDKITMMIFLIKSLMNKF